jgi:hypothetical protein
MSVAPNGRIDIIWLDTRDNPGTYLSSLYYSYSLDYGITWSLNERLSEEFDPHLGWPQQNKMGDYFDMISDNDGASIAWVGTFNGEEDVYFGRIIHSPVAIDDIETNLVKSFNLFQNFPNPFNPTTIIKYQIAEAGFVSLKVYDVLGNEVATLVDEYKQAGNFEVSFSAEELVSGISTKGRYASGVYFYQLQAGSFIETKKMMLLQ